MGEKDLQNMSLEQIKSYMDVLQKSSEAYLFILDLASDVYMIPEKLTERVNLSSTRSYSSVRLSDGRGGHYEMRFGRTDGS